MKVMNRCFLQVPNGPQKIFKAIDELVDVLCRHICVLKNTRPLFNLYPTIKCWSMVPALCALFVSNSEMNMGIQLRLRAKAIASMPSVVSD